MHVRHSKIAIVLCLAAFALLVTVNNVVDYRSNFEFVRHVLAMDTTFPGNRLMARALTLPAAWHAAYWLIIAGEGATGLCLLAGAAAMWRQRRADGARFEAARKWAVLGATLGFLVWFFGFMVIGGEWFLMWQSQTWNGQEAAFRLSMVFLCALIYLGLPERDASAANGA